MNDPNDTLYAKPRRYIDWYPQYIHAERRRETAADVVNRLKTECGSMFVAGWNGHCDLEAGGKGKGTYDPRRQQHLADSFLRGLRYHHCDIRDLCWRNQVWVDWQQVWEQQERQNHLRHLARTTGKGYPAPDDDKGLGKRPADPSWSTSSSSRRWNEPGSSSRSRR